MPDLNAGLGAFIQSLCLFLGMGVVPSIAWLAFLWSRSWELPILVPIVLSLGTLLYLWTLGRAAWILWCEFNFCQVEAEFEQMYEEMGWTKLS